MIPTNYLQSTCCVLSCSKPHSFVHAQPILIYTHLSRSYDYSHHGNKLVKQFAQNAKVIKWQSTLGTKIFVTSPSWLYLGPLVDNDGAQKLLEAPGLRRTPHDLIVLPWGLL
jgi:hypothetical protein